MRKPDTGQHRPLREDVLEIDRAILRLLLKRHNLLEKMRVKGRLESAEEKLLREAWQAQASRLSRDPELTGRFFSLLQNMQFLPRPEDDRGGDGPGRLRREAFNLAPAKEPVHLEFKAPVSAWETVAWLYLAAASGQPMRLEPILQNDSQTDFIKTLIALGAQVNRGVDNVATLASMPLRRDDIVIHTGDNPDNFYIFLAHYLGRASKAKFSGHINLELADFSALRHSLGLLGARLVHIIPKSNELPVRIECSGILPPSFDFGSELPARFGSALALAAPFYETPFAINFAGHKNRQSIFEHVLPLLNASGAIYALDNYCINLEPSPLTIPAVPKLSVEVATAVFLLAFAEALRGDVALSGQWPEWPKAVKLWQILQKLKLAWKQTACVLTVKVKTPIQQMPLRELNQDELTDLGEIAVPLLSSLAACAVLGGGEATLPEKWINLPEIIDFYNACGLEIAVDGKLAKKSDTESGTVWNAPEPAWAMALALAACARSGSRGFRLGNPGIMTGLWPEFWSIYNKFPNPRPKNPELADSGRIKPRRRILTNAISTPPELREEDWD